jgi:hypothetical protein
LISLWWDLIFSLFGDLATVEDDFLDFMDAVFEVGFLGFVYLGGYDQLS